MQYGIPEGSSTDLPIQQIDEEQHTAEKRMAAFVDRPEWEILKKHFQERISFYQTFLPDGRPLTDADDQERANMWVIANTIIAEFNSVINVYEETAANVQSD